MRLPLVGFEGHYEVSDGGIVYRIARGKGGEIGPLKPYVLKNGYATVYPSKNDRRKQLSVHHAVAEAFLGPRNGREVNHKDGNKANNAATNLEYVSRADNAAHASANGLLQRGSNRWNARLTAAEVRRIRRLHADGLTQKELAQRFGVDRATIYDVVRLVTWKWVGF